MSYRNDLLRAFDDLLGDLLADLEERIEEMEARPTVPIKADELRIPCSREEDVVGTGYHKHRCACGNVWKHSNAIGGGKCSKEEFREAHTCEKCGAYETMKFGGW